MKTAHIFYWNYLNPNGEKMSIGGIQTYITNLLDVLYDLGYNAIIYQRGDVNFQKVVNSRLTVYGYAGKANKARGLKGMLYANAKKKINSDEGDIVIFGSDELTVKIGNRTPVVAIQHGISWDVPEVGLSSLQYAYRYLKKQYHAWRVTRQLKYNDHVVCVDCNFINWYRALVPCLQVKLHYIPNFSSLPIEPNVKPDTKNGINVMFARRFYAKRGTRIFMNVAKHILAEYDNICITIAGEGPDEILLKENLAEYSHVHFIRYDSRDSLAVHSDKHIAVIPTLGSEGTSLSLLEAMAAGCAVVCTNVGGMTNVVIDEYNGLLIEPEEDALYQALKRLIENESDRVLMAQRGYETIVKSFSSDKWRNSWKIILKQLNNN